MIIPFCVLALAQLWQLRLYANQFILTGSNKLVFIAFSIALPHSNALPHSIALPHSRCQFSCWFIVFRHQTIFTSFILSTCTRLLVATKGIYRLWNIHLLYVQMFIETYIRIHFLGCFICILMQWHSSMRRINCFATDSIGSIGCRSYLSSFLALSLNSILILFWCVHRIN